MELLLPFVLAMVVAPKRMRGGVYKFGGEEVKTSSRTNSTQDPAGSKSHSGEDRSKGVYGEVVELSEAKSSQTSSEEPKDTPETTSAFELTVETDIQQP